MVTQRDTLLNFRMSGHTCSCAEPVNANDDPTGQVAELCSERTHFLLLAEHGMSEDNFVGVGTFVPAPRTLSFEGQLRIHDISAGSLDEVCSHPLTTGCARLSIMRRHGG